MTENVDYEKVDWDLKGGGIMRGVMCLHCGEIFNNMEDFPGGYGLMGHQKYNRCEPNSDFKGLTAMQIWINLIDDVVGEVR